MSPKAPILLGRRPHPISLASVLLIADCRGANAYLQVETNQ